MVFTPHCFEATTLLVIFGTNASCTKLKFFTHKTLRTHTLLFALGLVLVSATKLRLAALSVGIGEAVLLVLTLVVIAKKLFQKNILVGRKSRVFGIFILISVGLLFAGTLTALLRGVWRYDLFLHDGLALIFTFVSVFFNWNEVQNQRQVTVFGMLLVLLFGLLSFIYVAFYFASTRTDAFDNLVYDEFRWRFVGFSQNPNQVALFLCPLPFLIFFQKYPNLKRGLSVLLKITMLACVGQLGRLTQSDALYLSWLVGAVAWAFHWYFGVKTIIPKQLLKIALFIGFAALGYGGMRAYFQEKFDHDQQGFERLIRWQYGLEALGRSVLWGLGPGAFSGTLRAFEGEEAHNSFIDWADATGILGLGGLLMFVGIILKKCWSGHQPVLLAAAVALLVFSSFHYVLRQPVFWVYLLLFWSIEQPVRKL